MQFRAKQIAPPKDWGTFEDLCHALFKRVFKDPLAHKHGRRGQTQQGVDIYGRPSSEGTKFHGVQCKGKEANYGSTVEWTEVLKELTKAEAFTPPLGFWIFATTAPTDTHLQQKARELTVQREAQGFFGIDVLGWEDIQAMMVGEPEVIAEFYPEHADNLPQILSALRGLPEIAERLGYLLRSDSKWRPQSPGRFPLSPWELVAFADDRGLGPALMGRALGPSDAAACPRLVEVDSVLSQLRIAHAARVIGEPGSGKSICAYQAARELANYGYTILRLLDPQDDHVALPETLRTQKCLYLLDDAHLLPPSALARLELQASPTQLILSTHNSTERMSHRGAIRLNATRAVKTIATALRKDLTSTMKAVRLADDEVGEHMMTTDIGERINQAETSAERPWQFCFILGGGWRRSGLAADTARAAGADLVLAAISIRQLATRDARAGTQDIAAVCAFADIETAGLQQHLDFLEQQRLIISLEDCRTPHQRFASVVLKRLLEGANRDRSTAIARMVERICCSPQTPYAGIRVLIHELRFGSGTYIWTRLLSQDGVAGIVARCWTAQRTERGAAAMALSDLWEFSDGGAAAVIGPHASTLSAWLSDPLEGAYGLGHLLNGLVQKDKNIAVNVVANADALKLASVYSSATPDTAYGLAHLLNSVKYADVPSINDAIRDAIDYGQLLQLATHPAFLEDAYIFATFCASVLRWDEDKTLELAELFVPTAQQVLRKDPIEGFHQLSMDFASTVLRVFDVLGVWVGKHAPTPRHRAIARRLCALVDPKEVARAISSIPPRHFQSAAFFLSFLLRTAPRKHHAVIDQIDWERLDVAIGDDWKRMHHETEVLLGTLYSGQPTQHLVKKFITDRAHRIVVFPPRLMLMVPDAGIAHLAKGGLLPLAAHDMVSWDFGGLALAIIGEKRPDLVESVVAPIVDQLARGIESYSRSSVGPADGFLQMAMKYAPVAWHQTLRTLNIPVAEKGLSECLLGDSDHRQAAAVVIESAMKLALPIGDMARRLRAKFPKTSMPLKDSTHFRRRRRLAHRKKAK